MSLGCCSFTGGDGEQRSIAANIFEPFFEMLGVDVYRDGLLDL